VLREDLKTHDGKVTEPGFLAVAAHRLGERLFQVKTPVLRQMADAAYKTASTAVDWIWGIRIPRHLKLGRRVRIWHYGCILLEAESIGDDVHIRQCTTFGALRGTETGDRSLPIIEDGTDFGAGSCVMGPVTVGRGALVGANSVVLKDIPPGTSVLGVPARTIPQFGLPNRTMAK
jgi:serine O-acetyltransferase